MKSEESRSRYAAVRGVNPSNRMVEAAQEEVKRLNIKRNGGVFDPGYGLTFEDMRKAITASLKEYGK